MRQLMNCLITFVSRCSRIFAPDPKSYQTTRLHVTSLEATNPAMPYFKAGVTGNGQISETSKWTLTHFEIFLIQRQYCILIEIYTYKTNPSDVIHSPECILIWLDIGSLFFSMRWMCGLRPPGRGHGRMAGSRAQQKRLGVVQAGGPADVAWICFGQKSRINYYMWLLFFPLSLSLKDVLQLNIYILHNPM